MYHIDSKFMCFMYFGSIILIYVVMVFRLYFNEVLIYFIYRYIVNYKCILNMVGVYIYI